MTDIERLQAYVRGGSKGTIDLRWSNFTGMFLVYADVRGIDFSFSNFSNCVLDHSLMEGCNFTGCNFDHCSVVQTALNKTNWEYATIRSTKLGVAQMDYDAPDGWAYYSPRY